MDQIRKEIKTKLTRQSKVLLEHVDSLDGALSTSSGVVDKLDPFIIRRGDNTFWKDIVRLFIGFASYSDLLVVKLNEIINKY